MVGAEGAGVDEVGVDAVDEACHVGEAVEEGEDDGGAEGCDEDYHALVWVLVGGRVGEKGQSGFRTRIARASSLHTRRWSWCYTASSMPSPERAPWSRVCCRR